MRPDNVTEERIHQRLAEVKNVAQTGIVHSATTHRLTVTLPKPLLGEEVTIHTDSGSLSAVIREISKTTTDVTPQSLAHRIFPGAEVRSGLSPRRIQIGPELCGTVRNGFGTTLRRIAAPEPRLTRTLEPIWVQPNQTAAELPHRSGQRKTFLTKISAIDAFCTMAQGQRMAIMAPPGVGKSRLIQDLIRNAEADIFVIGLIGERGREIQELIDGIAPESASKRTIVVAASSSTTCYERSAAAILATTYAEYFRDCGKSVLLVMDSLTRLARAWREEALNSGELPARAGYPTSVFQRLPSLLERAGATRSGSITALYSLLQSNDIVEDPLIEEVCGIVDGHLFLDKRLAQQGIFPALSIPNSLSRLATCLLTNEQQKLITELRARIAAFEEDRELIQLSGETNEILSTLRENYLKIIHALQDSSPYTTFGELFTQLFAVLGSLTRIENNAVRDDSKD